MMTSDDIQALFTRSDGSYLCARWGRPIVPVLFGVEDSTIATVKGAFEAICALTGHKMAETDPEFGANVMMFFCRDWAELLAVRDLHRMVDGLAETVDRLSDVGANQYRVFRFDEAGAIKACFVFLKADEALSALPAEDLALAQAAEAFLLWSDTAFQSRSSLANLGDDHIVLHPEIAAILKAAYDPVMPSVATESGHALRLFARIQVV